MSYQTEAIQPIPKETVRTAKAIFDGGNFYLTIGERLEAILEGVHFECLSGDVRNLMLGSTVLPFMTLFQFVEGLTDLQAVDAVRTRVEWKYALHLPVNAPVFLESILCKFRWMLWSNPQGQHEFQKLVDRLIVLRPLVSIKVQSFTSQEILAVVCTINRLQAGKDAFSRAIEVLANKFPEWLLKITLPHWYGRYKRTSSGIDSSGSLRQPELSMRELGADILHLLKEVHRAGSHEIDDLQEIRALESVWSRQFEKEFLCVMDGSAPLGLNACDLCMMTKGGNQEKNAIGQFRTYLI